ncbi:MAG: carbon starvation protein A [Planctomycetes bacterium]|nr:carbon starvation protein A [Planctomycetota bacterium]
MLAVTIAVGSLILYYVAYRAYGGFLSRRVFRVRDEEVSPAVEYKDDVDYVPTDRKVLFGHHFASIAGLGPIMGPAVAVIWGWLPGLLWVLLGSIFIGAVHDFGALVISARNEGKSIGEVVGRVIGGRARILFMVISAFLISLAMGVFAYTVGALFSALYPETVVSVFGLMGLALVLGVLIYKKGLGLLPVTVFGIVIMFLLIWAGIAKPVNLYRQFVGRDTLGAVDGIEQVEGKTLPAAVMKAKLAARGDSAASADVGVAMDKSRSTWILLLLVYAAIASVLPVWLLLQPRDYINSYLLYLGMLLLYVGLAVAHPPMAAPAYRTAEEVGHGIFPLLFVVVACGAISGFHCLVASGTTSKQLGRMKEAQFIGYGAMLAEGALAVVVILTCASGIRAADYASYYGDWDKLTAGQLPQKVAAFVDGGANLFNHLYIPTEWGKAVISLVVVSFAMTTLDSGTRLLRYNIEELGSALKLGFLRNRYVATSIGVALLAFFAFVKIKVPVPADDAVKLVDQPAGLAIWALFGASNQLLAALGLLAVAAYLRMKGRSSVMYLLPFFFLLVVTGAALYLRLKIDIADGNWSLVVTEIVTAVLALLLIIEGALFFLKTRPGGKKLALQETRET